MNTLLLNPSNWDLLLDASGNIAMATDPYAVEQDVASAMRLFLGELYYDTSKGVPYFSEILGESPSMSYIASQLRLAALTVPEVIDATITAIWGTTRNVQCTCQLTTLYGTAVVTI